jgi:hypothetical protein
LLGLLKAWAAPVLLAVYAPVALLAANLGELEPGAAGRALVFSVGVGVLASLGGRWVLRRRESGVVLASAAVLAFFSYGHVYDGLKEVGAAGVLIARHRYLLPMEVGLLVALWLVLIRRPRIGPPVARWLTAVSWIVLVFPAVSLIQGQIRQLHSARPQPEASTAQLVETGGIVPTSTM